MRVLLSSSGTGKYEPTKCRYNNKVTTESQFMVTTLYDFFRPKGVFIITASKVKGIHGFEPKRRITLEAIDAPFGRNYNELRKSFREVVKNIPDNAEFTLDATHGLRSQPARSYRTSRFAYKSWNLFGGLSHTNFFIVR